MTTEDSGIPCEDRAILEAAGTCAALRDAGVPTFEALTSRATGVVVTDRRSSWVRLLGLGTTNVYIKTYDYPTPADRRRGMFRTTFLAASRPAREWAALAWFDANGFPAPEPLYCGEDRRFGFLRRAVLVTRAWDGSSAEETLPGLAPDDARALVAAIVGQVRAWHDAGFRDRNLDLRNLLVRRAADSSWVVVKIDSPRWRLRQARGDARDADTRRDFARLGRDLERIGLGHLAPRGTP